MRDIYHGDNTVRVYDNVRTGPTWSTRRPVARWYQVSDLWVRFGM